MIGRKGAFKRSLPLLVGDLFIVPLSYLAGYYIRSHLGSIAPFSEIIPLFLLILMTAIYVLTFYFFDLYELRRNYFSWNAFANILLSILIAAVIISFFKYGLFLFPIGRGILTLANLIILVSVFGWRIFCHYLFKRLIIPKRLLILGAGQAGIEIAKVIKTSGEDLEVVGFVDEDEKKTGKHVENVNLKVLGIPDKISSLAENHNIDQIIIANPEEKGPQLTKTLLEARLKGIEVVDMPEMYQIIKGKIPINHIEESLFLEAKGFGMSEKNFMIKFKRIIDIFFSSLILLISLPLWPIIALLIKINSKGPVFYKQKRIGKNELIFSLIKFRSMIDRAEKDKALWADENDKRITFVGRILRNLHLDELPQLWNVIRGEMSLVGPRPERPEFVDELKRQIPYYSLRHFMKPGLTGWAQVNYPYASSLEHSHEKLEYDLYYISHMNLLLDLRILLNTLKSTFSRRGKK